MMERLRYKPQALRFGYFIKDPNHPETFIQVGAQFPEITYIRASNPIREYYKSRGVKKIIESHRGADRVLFAALWKVPGSKGIYHSDWNGGLLYLYGCGNGFLLIHWKRKLPKKIHTKEKMLSAFLKEYSHQIANLIERA